MTPILAIILLKRDRIGIASLADGPWVWEMKKQQQNYFRRISILFACLSETRQRGPTSANGIDLTADSRSHRSRDLIFWNHPQPESNCVIFVGFSKYFNALHRFWRKQLHSRGHTISLARTKALRILHCGFSCRFSSILLAQEPVLTFRGSGLFRSSASSGPRDSWGPNPIVCSSPV